MLSQGARSVNAPEETLDNLCQVLQAALPPSPDLPSTKFRPLRAKLALYYGRSRVIGSLGRKDEKYE